MTDAEKIREALKLMEEHLTVSIMRGGTVRNVYLLLSGGVEHKLPPMPKKRRGSGIKEFVTSAMIEKRFGIKV